uniref:CBM21 domain-containing protein n=1 Tax=Lates calcarifer TaxID=8187 RepID=A0A4W6C193_LATCA
MPVDLAMCLSLSQRQPLYQLLSMSPLKPTQHHCQPTDCLSSVNKKRVVFADAKGLALTAVRLFIPEPSSPTPTLVMKPSPAKLCGLGFPQPTLDFKAFLARLREMRVQLESCNISEHSLSGKVCVSHVSAEKAVHVRVTFDSWRSHHDIPCTFLQQQRHGGSDMGIFSFDLSLPQNINPKERIEFCVSLRPGAGATPLWDDNRGQNYRVCVEKDGSNTKQRDTNRCYPTLSKYRPPSWPSSVSLSMQDSADLQHLQRSLSSRVRAEWKTLCSTN